MVARNLSQRHSETDCTQTKISEKSRPPNVRNTHSSVTNTWSKLSRIPHVNCALRTKLRHSLHRKSSRGMVLDLLLFSIHSMNSTVEAGG
eukprot:COSAG02_NODE_720_length_18054_cov_23.121192_2_plen_90_part_00